MNSPIIDVAIGLVFVYVVLSLLASSIQEWIASLLGLRSRNLYRGLRRLLGAGMAKEVYGHPMIRRLAKKDRHPVLDEEVAKGKRWLSAKWDRLLPKAPSYIDSRTLGTVLMVLVNQKEGGQRGGDRDRDADSADIRRILEAIRQRTPNISENQTVDELAEWFDEGMKRVSGWYKRQAKLWIFGIATVITVVANASTIHIAEKLWIDDALRSVVAEEATALVQDGVPADSVQAHLSSTLKTLPIWWNDGFPDGVAEWAKSVVGWFITIAAISLGAPFWFDLLGKVAHLKGSGGQIKEQKQPRNGPRRGTRRAEEQTG